MDRNAPSLIQSGELILGRSGFRRVATGSDAVNEAGRLAGGQWEEQHHAQHRGKQRPVDVGRRIGIASAARSMPRDRGTPRRTRSSAAHVARPAARDVRSSVAPAFDENVVRERIGRQQGDGAHSLRVSPREVERRAGAVRDSEQVDSLVVELVEKVGQIDDDVGSGVARQVGLLSPVVRDRRGCAPGSRAR